MSLALTLHDVTVRSLCCAVNEKKLLPPDVVSNQAALFQLQEFLLLVLRPQRLQLCALVLLMTSVGTMSEFVARLLCAWLLLLTEVYSSDENVGGALASAVAGAGPAASAVGASDNKANASAAIPVSGVWCVPSCACVVLTVDCVVVTFVHSCLQMQLWPTWWSLSTATCLASATTDGTAAGLPSGSLFARSLPYWSKTSIGTPHSRDCAHIRMCGGSLARVALFSLAHLLLAVLQRL
jgi:hypothetical protein